jgi:RimJ/RimL family protein N-acetyltransferase
MRPRILAPELETERLSLRMLEEEHFDEYARIHADPEVTKFTNRATLDRNDAFRHMAMIVGHWHLRGYGMWGVFEKSSGALVGRVGFHNPEGWPAFELGWTLGRDYWGKGYATEAARRCLEYGFREMDRDHIISLIDPLNTGSIRVAERLGYTIEGEWEYMGHVLRIYGKSRD